MKPGRLILAVLLSATLGIPAAMAAGTEVSGSVYGGWSVTQGDVSDVADDGWLLGAGVVVQPQNSPVGLTVGLEYSEYDLDRTVVDLFDGSGGDVIIWGVPVGALWSSDSAGPIDFFVSGGIGVYRVEGRIFDVGIVTYPPICDPWTWWCIPGGPGVGEFVRDSETTTKLGYHASIGLSVETAGDAEFFVEARWQQIETKNASEILPLLIGFRW